jgi:hypothetical protein
MESRIGASKAQIEPTATKIDQHGNSLPQRYFIKHFTIVIEKPSQKYDKELEKLKH